MTIAAKAGRLVYDKAGGLERANRGREGGRKNGRDVDLEEGAKRSLKLII